MAKAHLKYNLSDCDDLQEYKRATKATDMAAMLWDLLRDSRKTIEAQFENQDNAHNDVFDGVEAVFKRIYELADEYNIDIDELYT